MKVDELARTLGMTVTGVGAGAHAMGVDLTNGSDTKLKPSEALLIVGWLEEGRYTAVRRAIQLEISNHRCPACGEPEKADTTECQRCGRVW